MHRPIPSRRRSAEALTVLTAAACLPFATSASAQTWVNPNSGSWSVGANWIGGVPVSSASTLLRFNAVGAQSYSSFNNLGAFTLGQLDLNNAGNGVITLQGNPLQTDATVNVNSLGNGAVTIQNALNSISAPTTTTGGIFNFSGGNVTISGGANLKALTSSSGNLTISGGNYTLTSTQRRKDVLAAQDTGPWSLSIGENNSATANLSQTGGIINAGQGFINVGGDTDGTWSVSGASTVANFSFGVVDAAVGRFGILNGDGTLNVSGGALMSGRLFEVGRQSTEADLTTPRNGNYTVNVTGANSRINAHQLVTRARGSATINVNSGGAINLTEIDATGSIGAALLVMGSATEGVLAEPAPQTAVMNIGAGGTVRAIQPQIGGELGAATINITGGGDYIANTSPAPATLGEAIFLGDDDALDGTGTDNTTGFGAINVSGAGSTLDQRTAAGGNIILGGGGPAPQGGDAVITVSNGGAVFSNDMVVGQDTGSDGTLTINDATSTVNLVPNNAGTVASIVVAGNRDALISTGHVFINAGTLSTGNTFFGGGFVDGVGDPVPGGNATITIAAAGRLVVTDQFTMASTLQSAGTMNVNGGIVSVGGNAFTSPSDETTASSVINMNGGTMTMAGQMQVAGAGSVAGGSSVINLSNGAVMTTTSAGTAGLMAVFAPGTVNIGTSGAFRGGNSPASLIVNGADLAVDGRINYNSGTLNVQNGTLFVGAGRVQLSSADRDINGTPANKKTIVAGTIDLHVGTVITGVIDLNDNDMIVRSQSRAEVETYIANARNGGEWDQAGITSTAAKNNTQDNTTLGVIDGSDYISVHGTTFNGYTVGANDRIVRYTYYGDTDLNGAIDFDDYVRTDFGFNNQSGIMSSWFNGDFDLNGIVDFDDYVLLDLAFNTQGATLDRMSDVFELAGPTGDRNIGNTLGKLGLKLADMTLSEQMALKHYEQFGADYRHSFLNGGSIVPEPATVGVLGAVSALGSCLRRRRKR